MGKKEKTTRAAAIRYDGEKDSAPRLTARGQGRVAEKIIELARKNDIPIVNDPVLVQVLSKLDIDSEIPPELYRAMAEILAFVYELNDSYREKREVALTGRPCN